MSASRSLTPIFLSHSDGIEIRHVQLIRNSTSSTFWLSNASSITSTSPSSNELHSSLRIQAFPDYLLLSVWENISVRIITDIGNGVDVPLSTTQEIKSYVLEDGSQFHAPSRRWGVEFDYDHSISNSMRPPPILTHEVDPSTTVNPVDLLVDGNRLINDDKILDCDDSLNNILSAEEQPIEHHTTTPRASLSQVDNMASVEPLPHDSTYDEEPTQPLPYAENITQLREFTSNGTEQAGNTQKKQPHRLQYGEKATQQLGSDVERIVTTVVRAKSLDSNGGTPGRLLIQDPAGRASLTVPRAAYVASTQDVTASDPAVADDEILDSEIEWEPETHEPGPKSVTTAKLTQKSNLSIQSAPEKSQVNEDIKDDIKNDIFQDQPSDRPKKRCRVLTMAKSRTQEEPDTTRSPPRKRVKKEMKDDTSASEGPNKPTIAKQRIARRRIRSSPEKEDKIGNQPNESDTVAAITDDTAASTRRRTRSASVDKPRRLPKKPRVVLSSSIEDTKKYEKTLKSLGAVIIHDVAESDVFCVSDGEVKKTLKFVLAIIYGKFIVKESWLDECVRTKTLVDTSDHIPDNQGPDSSWSLTESVGRDRRRSTTRLLESWTVYLSEQLAKELGATRVKEQKQIANAMGAKFYPRLPTKSAGPQRLILGSRDDAYAKTVERSGHPFFLREMLTMVALRGTLDMDSDEFRIRPMIKEEDSD